MRRMPAGEPRNSRIQRAVMQLILDRKLRPGAPLPTETELMEDLGISRNSVREALPALQALDLVEMLYQQSFLDKGNWKLPFRWPAAPFTGPGWPCHARRRREWVHEPVPRRRHRAAHPEAG